MGGRRVKTPDWAAEEYKKSTRLFYHNSYVDIPLPFDVLNRYTDHCSKTQSTANLLPENIPNVIQEFGQGLDIGLQPSKLSRLFSPK
jgi:hypothetical protein